MDWQRGVFRLWLLAAIVWVVGALYVQLRAVTPTAAQAAANIQIKISDTETWEYPVAWGVARIRDDVASRLRAEDEADRTWASQLPATRKAQCAAEPRDLPFDRMDKDCVRLLFANDTRVVPTGWEAQIKTAPPCKNGNAVCEPWERDWAGAQLSPGTMVNDQGVLTSAPSSFWEAALSATPWAVLPPLIVLGIGGGLFWAFAGFRRRPPTSK